MSEKKAPEKKEKEKLVHVTEEQLKAGKEEIMKIVERPARRREAGRDAGQGP